MEGGSSGKIGPFVGAVTQTFIDDVKFENSVELGPLRLALQAKRTPKDGQTYPSDFESLGVELFGVKLFRESYEGRRRLEAAACGRGFDNRELVVVRPERRKDDVGLRGRAADPARFMEDPD